MRPVYTLGNEGYGFLFRRLANSRTRAVPRISSIYTTTDRTTLPSKRTESCKASGQVARIAGDRPENIHTTFRVSRW